MAFCRRFGQITREYYFFLLGVVKFNGQNCFCHDCFIYFNEFQNRDYIEALVDKLNAGKPLCPVGLNTLVIPRKGTADSSNEMEQPYVYLNCGHVQGQHSWGQDKDSDARRCSLCFKVAPPFFFFEIEFQINIFNRIDKKKVFLFRSVPL